MRRATHRRRAALLPRRRSAAAPAPRADLGRARRWTTVCSSYLSTSGLRSPAISLFAFGPVVRSGVGLAYLLQPDHVTLNVSSWKGEGPPAAKVAEQVEAALAQLRALVETQPPPPPRSRL